MSSNELALDWLSRFSFGNQLSDSGRDAIRETISRVTAPVGAVILDEGAACDPVVLLDQGAIRVYKRVDDNREITLYRVHPGEVCVVAVISVLGDVPYAATATASEPIEGFAIPVKTFRRVFAEETAMQRFIMRLVAERMALLMSAVVEVGFHNLDRRLARFLLDTSAESATRGAVEFSHEEIATELGTVREVITRVLDSFEAKGLVSLGRRRIDLPKRSELSDLAQGQRR